MIVIPDGATGALRGDTLVRAVIRSDMAPVPQTVEIEVRANGETAGMVEGASLRVGREQVPFLIVKRSSDAPPGLVAGARDMRSFTVIGLLASCAAVASPRRSAVVAYQATIGGVYRACGATASIGGDITIPAFACYVGMTPSFEIARALQEQAGGIISDERGRVSFRRLVDLQKELPSRVIERESVAADESGFVERHLVPAAFSTGPDGAFLRGAAGTGRGIIYRPQASQAILANLSRALIVRRMVSSGFAPDITAGQVIEVAGERFVVATAAHAFSAAEQSSTLWLGKVVT